MLALYACSVPESCDQMCDASADAWSTCAQDAPLGWQSTPFDDAADHQDWCETWIWEQNQLDDDLAATCAERRQYLRTASCDELQ